MTLSITTICHHSECFYVVSHVILCYAEYHYVIMTSVLKLNAGMLSVMGPMHCYLSLCTYSYHFQLVWPNCPVLNKLTVWTHHDITHISITTIFTMEQCTFKNVNNYLNTHIYSYLKTSGSLSYYIYI
jgi:hypothetical protein